jgi:lipopolysaccharide heptosyltransferase II
MTKLKKILIIRPRFLGDLILATGLAETIRKNNPAAQIWYLTETHYAEALDNHPLISGVLRLDARQKNNPFYLLGFYRRLRREKFDAVLDLFGNPRTAQMAFFSGAPVRVGFAGKGRNWAYTTIARPSSDPLPSGRRPVTEAYLDHLRALGFDTSTPYRTSLTVTPEEKSHVQKLFERAGLKTGQKIAALAPGASWPAKQWPLEGFLELGHWLKREGVRPLYLFGPKEMDLAEEFQEHMDKDWLFINQPNIRGLAAFIEAADILISNDSGPMHVGPAVGTPTLGIFGPGEPEVWFPYGKGHQVAYAEIACSHCGLDKCPLMACMDHLPPREMAQRALGMLKNN